MNAKKQLQKNRREIESALPDIVFQLILLLNSGMVLSRALKELCDANGESSNYLYVNLSEIMKLCADSNSSAVHEIYKFAGKSGSRSFMRFASLLVQSSDHGSALAEKLDSERNHLWQERLAFAKTKAKEAETRLSIPLVLLLLSLIIITISPALMSM